MNKLMLSATLASSASLGEPLTWLGLAFLCILGLITLCRHFISCLSRAFETSCDWLECRLAERRKRQHQPASPATTSAQSPRPASHGESLKRPAVPTVSRKRPLRANRHLRIVSAQDALRRNAESGQSLVRVE